MRQELYEALLNIVNGRGGTIGQIRNELGQLIADEKERGFETGDMDLQGNIIRICDNPTYDQKEAEADHADMIDEKNDAEAESDRIATLKRQFTEFLAEKNFKVNHGIGEDHAMRIGCKAFNNSTHEKYRIGTRVQGTAYHKNGAGVPNMQGTCKGFVVDNMVEYLVVQWDSQYFQISVRLNLSNLTIIQ